MGSLDAGRFAVRAGLAACSALALLVCPVAGVPDARACGGFFSAKAAEGARRPSLAYEQALIVFDARAKREHFVREVVFRAAHQPFGFVVPTPARPEVAAVKSSPFAGLRRDFPFQAAPKGALRGLGAVGSGAGRGMGGGVQVLETSRVGSFTAFVLAADDAAALTGWLAKNGFTSTRETDAWIAHYVKLKFYYVAMRYEPPKGAAPRTATADARTKSETVRISFDTPLPYYPYLEPKPGPGAAVRDARLLELWLVSRERFVPVAAREQKAKVHWVRPLAAGDEYQADSRRELLAALGSDSKILPAPEPGSGGAALRVQRFMDQKRSRAGYGDIVFVPAVKRPLDAQARARLAPLLPLLDARLLEAK
jgi:hypothetical protein